ncbi:unnamed protein product [Mytilus coruscus]|uniref:Uncharacterized protein n=1 Tax=Mytilus coruscus TaxID=42192 RepID=A0A6J8DCJ1_MYTCO|nr:unnamed protein product [Mytilus coruscus]
MPPQQPFLPQQLLFPQQPILPPQQVGMPYVPLQPSEQQVPGQGCVQPVQPTARNTVQNDELKTLRRNYIRALNACNSNSSTYNHKTLNECKKTYKLKERYLKRQYMKQEGDMLSVIRKTNPKLFYAKFKPKKKTLKSNLKLDDFYKHFKNLGLDSDNESTEESYNPSELNTHSLRIGSATQSFLDGLDKNSIKMKGRWKSAAYKGYIRTNLL